MSAKPFSADILKILFQKAPGADGPDCFRLLPVIRNLHLGRLTGGEYSVLVVLEGRPRSVTVEYGGLRLQLFEDAEVRIGSGRQDAALGVLTCLDVTVLHNFCILVADMCELLRSETGEFRTQQQFREYVARWADVFSLGLRLSRDAELGLWGELEVLSSLPDPELALASWHGPEAARFDFGGNGTYLEVKTSTLGHHHHFALEQASPPTERSKLFIASVAVIDDPASGRSLDEQVALLRTRLSTTLPLDRKLALLHYRSGVYGAKYSLKDVRYFSGEDIPRPRMVDDGVTDVRFVADLSKTRTAPAMALNAALKRLSR